MLHALLLVLYVFAAVGLFVYGANCYVLMVFYLRCRTRAARGNAAVIAGARRRFSERDRLPPVTTQIPVYNEANVAERALRAAAAIDYPADRHEIQVLDDSTDGTRETIDRVAAELCARGHRVRVLRRRNRAGFKAGALAVGLETATGEFIAIFDADFVPPPHFLHSALPFFFRDERMALVQARWGHLNQPESPLTRAQAMGIDGHFMVEQSARTFNGLLMNFNGTAGLWRRSAIADAGGWSADTLTEDLDLSYRAQLRGWHTHFLADLEVPGELPGTLAAFKSQQFRWAKGSIQTARKLLPRVFRSRRSPWVKLQAALHLTHYAVHPLMLMVALLALPAMAQVSHHGSPIWAAAMVAVIFFAMIAPNSLYLVSQRALYPHWWRRLYWLPALTCVGIGVAVSNSRAVLEALLGRPSDFVRTPKRGEHAAIRYAASRTVQPWIEIALGLYCAASLVFYLASGKYVIAPLLILYASSFLVIGAIGLAEMRGGVTAAAEDPAAALPANPAPAPGANLPPSVPAGRRWTDAIPAPSPGLPARRSA
jgi:cellulose synthase/poly-beta-1,6-N-acetylglucosamine synthase-like glycosyltransferase